MPVVEGQASNYISTILVEKVWLDCFKYYRIDCRDFLMKTINIIILV